MLPLFRRFHLGVLLLLLAVAGSLLTAWAVKESRLQRDETAAALAAQARVLATTLGPSLAAAATGSREFNELLTWRLLDDAGFIARLYGAGNLSAEDLEEVLEEQELDSIAIVDEQGRLLASHGAIVPPDILELIQPAAKGAADDVILAPAMEFGVEHLTVASALPAGGAVVVRIHSGSRRGLSGQLGVENLLEGLVGNEGILYLVYREEPGGIRHEVTWDGGPAPGLSAATSGIQEIRGRSAFQVGVPVTSPAGTRASLSVGLDAAPLERAVGSATRRTVLIGIVLVACSLALAGIGLIARWRALEKEEATRKLALSEAARRRSERLVAAGALTAGLAHEVRSPLNAIVMAAQRMMRKYPAESECVQFAGTIRSEVQRLDAILRQFLELARPVSDQRQLTDLGRLANEVRDLLQVEAEEKGLALPLVEGAGSAVVDEGSVRRSVINLVHNAMEASARGGTIEIVVCGEDGGTGIHVRDRGVGIPQEGADKLFEAFVTNRADGSGLGLALVRRVADEHDGRCSLANRQGGGAEAILWFPHHSGETTT